MLDPFILLDDELAPVVAGLTGGTSKDPDEDDAVGCAIPSANESPEFGRIARSRTSPVPGKQVGERTESRLAPTDRAPSDRAPAARTSGLLETSYPRPQKETPSVSEPSRARTIATLQEGRRASATLRRRGPGFERVKAFAPPRFSYGEDREEASKSVQAEAAFSSSRTVSSAGESENPAVVADLKSPFPDESGGPRSYKAASAGTGSAPSHPGKHNSRLVETAGLIHLLKQNAVPAEELQARSSPPRIVADAGYPTPVAPSERSEGSAVTVDGVLEQLEDRLHFEFLRTYGSSGE
jgi:hypothetical protein